MGPTGTGDPVCFEDLDLDHLRTLRGFVDHLLDTAMRKKRRPILELYKDLGLNGITTKSTRVLLNRLQDAHSSLTTVEDQLKSTVSSLQKGIEKLIIAESPSRHPPIYRLPDEMLSEIFSLSFKDAQECMPSTGILGDTSSSFQSFRLSRVCKRFRNVAFATPVLWTCVSNIQGPEVYQSMLGRAGALPLDVSVTSLNLELPGFAITYEDFRSHTMAFLNDLLPRHQSWKSFTIWLNDIADDTAQRIVQTLSLYNPPDSSRIVMPLLTRMQVTACNPGQVWDEDFIDTLNCYWNWTLPSIAHLHVGGVSPIPVASQAIGSLQSFHMVFTRAMDEESLFDEFLQFLQGLQLEELCITIFGFPNITPVHRPTISLPSIQTLRLNFSAFCDDVDPNPYMDEDEPDTEEDCRVATIGCAMDELARLMYTPSIVELSMNLDVFYCQSGDCSSILAPFLNPTRRVISGQYLTSLYPALRRLRFRYHVYDSGATGCMCFDHEDDPMEHPDVLHDFLSTFPTLEHLNIDCSFGTEYRYFRHYDPRTHIPDSLRSLTIGGSQSFVAQFIEKTASPNFKIGDANIRYLTLEEKYCSQVDKDILLSCIAENRVVWK